MTDNNKNKKVDREFTRLEQRFFQVFDEFLSKDEIKQKVIAGVKAIDTSEYDAIIENCSGERQHDSPPIILDK